MLYYNLSSYLRERYGKRMRKICIDGGFTCPNRDGKCGTGGCIFCGERGAGEHIDPCLSISEQVEKALRGASNDELFIAYFQNFTNTYADASTLRARYDAALTDNRIRILSVGTRPDCIDEDICALLKEYTEKYEVWVELGLQTVSDTTAEIINRGYPLEVFERAVSLLKKHGILFTVHMIIGLPGESIEDAKRTAEYISSIRPFGVKIHSIYVMRGTKLAKMHEEKRYTPPTLSEFVECAAYAVSVMPTDTVIHRLTGDCPHGMLVAPEWNSEKSYVIGAITDYMAKNGMSQGSNLK